MEFPQQRTALLLITAATLLAGCGSVGSPSSSSSTGTSATSSAAPVAMKDVATMSWPSATAGVEALFNQMPPTLAGMEGTYTMDDTFPVLLTYGSEPISYDGPTASPTIQIAVMNKIPGSEQDLASLPPEAKSPGLMLMAMFGLTQGCAPETLVSDPPMQSQAWMEQNRAVWFSCQVSLVQNHAELKGAQRRHVAGWAGPEQVAFLVDAPTDQARDQALSALVAARSE